MKKHISSLNLRTPIILLAAVLVLSSVVASQVPDAEFFVRLHGNKISLQADRTPLSEILAQLLRYQIRINLDPTINPAVTARFENLDIQDGLKRIFKNINYILIWSTDSGPFQPSPRLAEIQIFQPGRRDRIQPLRRLQGFQLNRQPSNGSSYVKGELLIQIRDPAAVERLEALLNAINAVVLEKHEKLGIYRLGVADQTDITELVRRLNDVAGERVAEANYAYPLINPAFRPHPPVESKRSPASAHADGKATVAILDSGLVRGSELEHLASASLDAIESENPLDDRTGHGTQMAYIASGTIAPLGGTGATATNPIIPIRAFDENGVTSGYTVMKSIDFAIQQGAKVLSLSWGSETRSDFLEQALAYAAANGLIIVAAAGNEPTGQPFYPAAYPSVIGVGALAPDGDRWEKSNYGASVDTSAPGVALLPIGYNGPAGVYAGTSVAAAYTANQIAAYLAEHPDANMNTVLQHLNKAPAPKD